MEINLSIFSQRTMKIFQSALRFVTHMEHGFIGSEHLLWALSAVLMRDQAFDTDLDGKVSLIMFFHTGCPDCQAELPVVQQIHEEFGLQIAICCISREEGPETVRTYWLENGLTLPYSAQEDRSVYSLFAGMGVPRVYVSGRDRVIYSVYDDSPIATPDQLEADIRACL